MQKFKIPFHILGKPIELEDLKFVDPEEYETIVWLKQNDPQLSSTDLEFHFKDGPFALMVVKELDPERRQIQITNDNKDKYIKLVLQWILVKEIKSEMDAFLKGFAELISLDDLKIFEEKELVVLMSGVGSTSESDLKQDIDAKVNRQL